MKAKNMGILKDVRNYLSRNGKKGGAATAAIPGHMSMAGKRSWEAGGEKSVARLAKARIASAEFRRKLAVVRKRGGKGGKL